MTDLLNDQILAEILADITIIEYDPEIHILPLVLADQAGCNKETARRALRARERAGELEMVSVRYNGRKNDAWKVKAR